MIQAHIDDDEARIASVLANKTHEQMSDGCA